MTATDQLKIVDNKIKTNQAQYNLSREAAKISALSSKALLEKYENLTDEDLGHRPSTLEKTKFEYSPLGKVFNKGLDKYDKEEGLFKTLKNIENKIKSENKKQSEPIKNEEQSVAIKDQSAMADKKPKEIVMLKGRLDNIFENRGSNFNSTGKKFIEKLAKDEKKIDYNNLFFYIDKPAVKIVDFLKEFGTVYDLLIYLLGNANRIISAS